MEEADMTNEPFKPCRVDLPDAGTVQFVFEDVAYFTRPVQDGIFHSADWMLAMDDKRLVGVQLWTGKR